MEPVYIFQQTFLTFLLFKFIPRHVVDFLRQQDSDHLVFLHHFHSAPNDIHLKGHIQNEILHPSMYHN